MKLIDMMQTRIIRMGDEVEHEHEDRDGDGVSFEYEPCIKIFGSFTAVCSFKYMGMLEDEYGDEHEDKDEHEDGYMVDCKESFEH